jgi:hypothetical protein
MFCIPILILRIATFEKSSVSELIEKGNNANERSEFKNAIEFYGQALALARESEDRRGESLALGER